MAKRYVPILRTPVFAVRLEEDFHAKAGMWVMADDKSEELKVCTDAAFRTCFAAEDGQPAVQEEEPTIETRAPRVAPKERRAYHRDQRINGVPAPSVRLLCSIIAGRNRLTGLVTSETAGDLAGMGGFCHRNYEGLVDAGMLIRRGRQGHYLTWSPTPAGIEFAILHANEAFHRTGVPMPILAVLEREERRLTAPQGELGVAGAEAAE